MKRTFISMLLMWALIHINAQSGTSKKISLRNFDINQIHASSLVGVQLKDGKLVVDIPKEAIAPKIVLDLYPDDSVLDLTTNPVINIKLKSDYGTFVRLFPIDANGITVADTGVLNRQKVRCSSEFQWSHHLLLTDTLSNGKPLNSIKQLGIAPDFGTGPVQDVVIEIDSILLGALGTPILPEYQVPEGKVWALNSLDGYYTLGADNAQVSANGLQLHFSEQKQALKGIGFKVMTGNGDDGYINMDNYPIIVIGFKGASNDTLRANLVTTNSLISNQAYKRINGDGTTSLDFSNLSSLYSFDKVTEIQLFLNDNHSSTGTLTITSLEAGMGQPMENCSGAIGIFDTQISESKNIIYPNPVMANEQVMVGESSQKVEFRTLNGTHIATVLVKSGYVSVPADLQQGLYLLKIVGKQAPSYAKLQIK